MAHAGRLISGNKYGCSWATLDGPESDPVNALGPVRAIYGRPLYYTFLSPHTPHRAFRAADPVRFVRAITSRPESLKIRKGPETQYPIDPVKPTPPLFDGSTVVSQRFFVTFSMYVLTL